MEGIVNLISRISEGRIREMLQPNGQAEAAETAAHEAARVDLMEQLKETSRELGAIRSCFETETDFDMLDSYIMQIDALEKRYSYLLKRAKQEHIAAF